jgi:hypothetical protein
MKPLFTPAAFLSLASIGFAQTAVTLDGASGSQSHNQSLSTDGGLTLDLGFKIDYLVVAGGGGGAGSQNDSTAWGGGGGGAGGLLLGDLFASPGSFSVVVGAGGAGGAMTSTTANQQGKNGADSSFGTITATGGGGGGAYKEEGNAGGSGGGGGGRGTGSDLRTAGGAGTSGQGNDGGASRDDNAIGRSAGGGGGGAGEAGSNGGTNVTVAGDGGDGLDVDITGADVTYAGGGGGGAQDTNTSETRGLGGAGGGGAGSTSGNATAGTANTGGGGGGAGTNGAGGAGGSGVVIARYGGAAAGTGGTVGAGTGTATGYTLHTFSTTGTSSLDLSGLDLSTRLGAVQTGVISGSGDLTFTGPGKLTLDAANTFTGTTRVNAGTLALGSSGSIAASAGLSIEAGASFDGSEVTGGFTVSPTQALSGGGTLIGDVTIDGTHTPGFSPGLQSFGDSLSYGNGASLVWQLADSSTGQRGTVWDAINVTGDLSFTGLTSLLLDFDPLASGTFTGGTVDWDDALWASALGTNGAGWKIFEVDGTITGLENLAIEGSSWLDSFGGDFSTSHPDLEFALYQYGDGVYLTTAEIVSPVPEPGSLVALAGLLGGGLSLRRRKA